jgi:hypothetical protein
MERKEHHMKTIHIPTFALAVGLLLCAPAFAQEPEPPPGPPPMPSELEILAFVETNLPETFQHLQQIKAEDPREYPHRIEMFGHMLIRYGELKPEHPKLAEGLLRAHRLDRQSEMLAEQIRQTQDKEATLELKKKLEGMLNQVFELRMAERELEVKHLERELNHIQTLLNTRRQAKKQIVDQHLRDLTFRGDEALGWW